MSTEYLLQYMVSNTCTVLDVVNLCSVVTTFYMTCFVGLCVDHACQVSVKLCSLRVLSYL